MTPNRRVIMTGAGALALAAAMPAAARAAGAFTSKRPPRRSVRFTSKAVEAEIARVKAKIADPELAWLFENCYPNTLDTTVRRARRRQARHLRHHRRYRRDVAARQLGAGPDLCPSDVAKDAEAAAAVPGR
jgi:hypothetical protein